MSRDSPKSDVCTTNFTGSPGSKQDQLVLFSYFRSSCAWRVRIALEHKGLTYQTVPVQLMKHEQLKEEFVKLNPMGQVPALIINGKATILQSLAILEYLEDRYPNKPLLPSDPIKRAVIRQICELIASGIQPLQNLSTLHKYSDNDNAKLAWAQFWIRRGLVGLEKMLEQTSGKYSVGDEVTMADCCVIPQIANAYRFKVDISPFPILIKIEKNLSGLPAFQLAHAANQPDCPPEMYSKL